MRQTRSIHALLRRRRRRWLALACVLVLGAVFPREAHTGHVHVVEREGKGFRAWAEALESEPGPGEVPEGEALVQHLESVLDLACPEIEQAVAHFVGGQHAFRRLGRLVDRTPPAGERASAPRPLDASTRAAREAPLRWVGATLEQVEVAVKLRGAAPPAVRARVAAALACAQLAPGGVLATCETRPIREPDLEWVLVGIPRTASHQLERQLFGYLRSAREIEPAVRAYADRGAAGRSGQEAEPQPDASPPPDSDPHPDPERGPRAALALHLARALVAAFDGSAPPLPGAAEFTAMAPDDRRALVRVTLALLPDDGLVGGARALIGALSEACGDDPSAEDLALLATIGELLEALGRPDPHAR